MGVSVTCMATFGKVPGLCGNQGSGTIAVNYYRSAELESAAW